jgi:hypothetical protein
LVFKITLPLILQALVADPELLPKEDGNLLNLRDRGMSVLP